MFLAAIVLHLLRIFFTGAFRKPRELTYCLGVTMLVLALLEGYIGYSLVDDLLSGMGLAIGYSVALSIPFVGANLTARWSGAGRSRASRRSGRGMYIAHVLLFPVADRRCCSARTWRSSRCATTRSSRGRARDGAALVGVPAFPGQAPRSLGLCSRVAGVLFLLGGLVQINPIWLWGPYHTYASHERRAAGLVPRLADRRAAARCRASTS